MNLRRLTIVGPLPPPAGGMANQTAKLAELLRGEGLQVEVIQTNPAYQPAWAGRVPVLRAGVRLLQFFRTLQRELNSDVQLIHLMANSGWSWHLFAAPVIWVARRKQIPLVLNYRGGYADAFFAKSWRIVEASLRHCALILVPSTFLQQVFARYGKDSVIVQNVLDTALFVPASSNNRDAGAPHVVVTRNLEAIYDVASCIRAFALIQQQFPAARLSIAGTGPELLMLQQLAADLQLQQVQFVGRLSPQQIAALYQDADLLLNGSLVDNTPNSLIEAMASGVPVVSTDSGGIPQLVTHKLDALLVGAKQPEQLAAAALQVLQDGALKQRLVQAGLDNAARFSWHKVWQLLQQQYLQVLAGEKRLMGSSWYTKLVSKLLFPLHERLKKHDTVAIFRQLEQSQWQSPQQLQDAQNQRLAGFIRRISTEVPYYRDLLQQLGLQAADIQTTADLAKLPLLDKTLIRAHSERLKNPGATLVRPFTTGGSSGTPLTFLLGNERISHDVAEKWRATRWWGVDIGDKEIVAWGSPIELNKQDKLKIWRDKLFRSHLIPAFDLTEAKILGFIRQIQQIQPAMLFGYPSVFHLIAKTAQQHAIDLTTLGIKVVFVTSERLYPYQRELIEQVFQAPVANGYGGRDAGFIAHQCPAGSMHISAEDIIVEIVDRHGDVLPDGQSGEIVVTHLATSDFPFVRYRTGDIATRSTALCSCGRGLPVLEQIEGRSTDFVVASNGTMMHGLALIYVIRELHGISNFKIIQESLTHTRVQLVLENGDMAALGATIEAGLKARLGADVQIEVEWVAQIAAEASGKYRYVISKVAL